MKKIILPVLFFAQSSVFAQQSLQVSDSMPVITEGLKGGYTITGTEEKEVGNKGNFSRYKIRFYVTNTSTEARIMMRRQGFAILGNDVSPNLATFKCLNATGARMTSKEFTLEARPCVVEALVDETDASSGKTVQTKKPANIGYWLKPGETISSNSIVIVPLNEKPDVMITFFPAKANMVGSAMNTEYTDNSNQYNTTRNTAAPSTPHGFVHIKNFASSNYLHNQNGPVACTPIDLEWWSAQWELVPVSGTNNLQIRNRWKANFITTENSTLLSDNGQSAKAMWLIEETSVRNIYYIKNAADNSKLIYQNGMLKTSSSYNTEVNSQWIIE
jgi:hypothetical protein